MILKGQQKQTFKREGGPTPPAVQDGGPALSQPGVAITTCTVSNLFPYACFTLLMAGVGALGTSLMFQSVKMQKELNEKGLHHLLAGGTGRG